MLSSVSQAAVDMKDGWSGGAAPIEDEAHGHVVSVGAVVTHARTRSPRPAAVIRAR
jgi:hypothetical protein